MSSYNRCRISFKQFILNFNMNEIDKTLPQWKQQQQHKGVKMAFPRKLEGNRVEDKLRRHKQQYLQKCTQ
ncbi:hypothetical protein GQ457_10G010250 [Hibiscus cannabinus]